MSLEIHIRYAETGDSQLLHFIPGATVEELKRQVMEYAEHGVSCKLPSMILLQENGVSLVKTSIPLSSLQSYNIFMFSKDTLVRSFVPTVALDDFSDLGLSQDAEGKKELCVRCLSRCRVQIEAGNVALRNLMEHSNSVLTSFKNFQSGPYQSYMEKSSILVDFEKHLENLGKLMLAHPKGRPTEPKRSMLDALPVEKIRRWVTDANRQHELVQQKYTEMVSSNQHIKVGCESLKADWDNLISKKNTLMADEIEKRLEDSNNDEQLASCIMELKQLKSDTTNALFFNLLRTVSQLQSKIQDLSNKIAGLKEGILIQEQLVHQISAVKDLPSAYDAALKEADRRRSFAVSFNAKVQQLTDFIGKTRDKELEQREAFHRHYGRILPPDLVPGLSPWVFPACEVTQRPIDSVLFANILERDDAITTTETDQQEQSAQIAENSSGVVLSEPETIPERAELTVLEALELEAENEILKGNNQGEALASLKLAHENEVEALKNRIVELEEYIEQIKKNTTSAEEKVVNQAEEVDQQNPDQGNEDATRLSEIDPDEQNKSRTVEEEQVVVQEQIENHDESQQSPQVGNDSSNRVPIEEINSPSSQQSDHNEKEEVDN